MPQLDLDRCTNSGRVHNLAGKDWGIRVRAELKLDELDNAPEPVDVLIPDHVYAVSPSFFLGLFSASLQRFGGANGFRKHYRFHAKPSVELQIEEGIRDWQARESTAGSMKH